MTPGAQLAAAIDILDAIEIGGRPADDAVADYFRRRRYIGAKDRAAISGHVYAVLRHRSGLDWWIDRVGQAALAPTPRGRLLAALTLIAGWSPEAIEHACDGGRFRPVALSPAETRLVAALKSRTLHHPEMPRAVANDLPEWLLAPLDRIFGRRLEAEMAALNAPAPVDLRVNRLKGTRAEALDALAAEGIAAEPMPFSPLGLRLGRRVPLGALTAFKSGLVEVQDESSQLAALLVGARPGMRVVDFCAGAGGKTLALAAAMANRGKLVACDTSARRLEAAARRLRRAGATNVERRRLTDEQDKWVKRHARSFDRVLVDAPCTGTGTWRRNPGGKWRTTPRDLAELTERQRAILESAARLARPGGRLVYATCSLLAEENEERVEAFLAASPDFVPIPIAGAWTETLDGTAPGGGNCLHLTPAQHGTDGFFVAILERRTDGG